MRPVVRAVEPLPKNMNPELLERIVKRFPSSKKSSPDPVHMNIYAIVGGLFLTDELITPRSKSKYFLERHHYFIHEHAMKAQQVLKDARLVRFTKAIPRKRATAAFATPRFVDTFGDIPVIAPPVKPGQVLLDRRPWDQAIAEDDSGVNWRSKENTFMEFEERLARINEGLRSFSLGYVKDAPFQSAYGRPYSKRGKWSRAELMPTTIQLSRMLNHIGDGDLGHGRFYQRRTNGLAYLNQSKDIRRYLAMDGARVANYDFSANHVNILCGLARIANPYEDPYLEVCDRLGLDESYRRDVKRFVIIAINRPTPEGFRKAQRTPDARDNRRRLLDVDKSPDDVYHTFMQMYPETVDLLTSEKLAHTIALYESEVIEQILLRGTEEHIPMAPLHDQIMFPAPRKDRVYEIMYEEMQRRFPSVEPRLSGPPYEGARPETPKPVQSQEPGRQVSLFEEGF